MKEGRAADIVKGPGFGNFSAGSAPAASCSARQGRSCAACRPVDNAVDDEDLLLSDEEDEAPPVIATQSSSVMW